MMNYLEKKKKALMNYVSGITPPLPSAYQQVEWIGNESGAWLQTDEYVLSTDTIDTEFAFTDTQTSDKYVICCIPWNTPSNARFSMGVHIGYFAVGFGGSGTGGTTFSPTVKDNDFHKWNYDNKNFEITDLEKSKDLSNTTYNDATNVTRGKVRIFWGYNSVTKGKIKSYIQKRNGQEILNLVPCYRKSDNEIGLYDIVNDTFYTNS